MKRETKLVGAAGHELSPALSRATTFDRSLGPYAYQRQGNPTIEEVEAINWYEQRLAVEPDREAAAIMRNAQEEEFKHFSMDLEYLLRRMPTWRETARGVLFTEGDIVELGEEAEEAAGD